MRIKLLTSIAGSNFSHSSGEVVNWPSDTEAQRLIEGGLAEAVPEVERAVRGEASENATRKPSTKPEGGKASRGK